MLIFIDEANAEDCWFPRNCGSWQRMREAVHRHFLLICHSGGGAGMYLPLSLNTSCKHEEGCSLGRVSEWTLKALILVLTGPLLMAVSPLSLQFLSTLFAPLNFVMEKVESILPSSLWHQLTRIWGRLQPPLSSSSAGSLCQLLMDCRKACLWKRETPLRSETVHGLSVPY